jgi:hypothetical protein
MQNMAVNRLTPILNVSDTHAVHRHCQMHVRHPDGHVFRISRSVER